MLGWPPTTVNRIEPEVTSSQRGPVSIEFNTGVNQTLVAAPGVGKALVITSVQMSMRDNMATQVILKEGVAGVTRVRFNTKGDRNAPPFAMNPGWRLPANTALVAQRTDGNKAVSLNCMFYTVDV